MGQCGCGDFQADKVYKLPGGTRIAVQLYPGCEYCHTDLGVLLHVFTAKGARSWCISDDETEDVIPDEYGACLQVIPMLGPEDLREAVRAIGYEVNPEDDNAYETLGDYIEDQGRALLREAFFACQERLAREKQNKEINRQEATDDE